MTASHCIRGGQDDLVDQIGHGALVAVCRVGLKHGELGAMRGVDSFIAEDPTNFVDPVHAADHDTLQVQLQRDPQGHRQIEGIQVCGERTRIRSTVDGLQRGGFHLQVLLPVQRLADSPHHCRALADHLPCLVAHDEIDISAAHPLLFGEILMKDRKGT